MKYAAFFPPRSGRPVMLVLAMLLSVSCVTHAGLVAYSEAAGDLTGDQTFVLDTPGINTVTGAAFWITDLDAGTQVVDSDPFGIILADTLRISGITVEATLTKNVGQIKMTPQWSLAIEESIPFPSFRGLVSFVRPVVGGSGPRTSFAEPLPYEFPEYVMFNSVSQQADGVSRVLDTRWNWSVEFDVRPVPLPSAFGFTLLTQFVLMPMSRRTRR